MNAEWQAFLSTHHAVASSNGRISFPDSPEAEANAPQFICPLSHLAVLKVSGADAVSFLQGQCTCNLNDITAQRGSFGAFCSNNGRVLTTFILLKSQEDWLIILPAELLSTMQQRLQKYILRSKVSLKDCSNELMILGINAQSPTVLPFSVPNEHLDCENEQGGILLCLSLDKSPRRFLYIADFVAGNKFWAQLRLLGFDAYDTLSWALLDIKAGIPWLTSNTTEEYIPQMLNLDKLGGISFNKGCYTGQEIVARTHYLGKSKRALYTAIIPHAQVDPAEKTAIIDSKQGQVIGHVLSSITAKNQCTLQAVLASESLADLSLVLETNPELSLMLQ